MPSRYNLSPLKYPGSKGKQRDEILRFVGESIQEFREPFCGSAEISLSAKQMYPHLHIWINDLDEDLIAFFRTVQKDAQRLYNDVTYLARTHRTDDAIRALFNHYASLTPKDEYEQGLRYYVLNRLSGVGSRFLRELGWGRSVDEWRRGSIFERILTVQPLLEGARITRLDFSDVCLAEGDNVFVFLDPPYITSAVHRLYRKLDLSFVPRLDKVLDTMPHAFLMTIDDNPISREWANRFYFKEVPYFAAGFYNHGKTLRRDLYIWNAFLESA